MIPLAFFCILIIVLFLFPLLTDIRPGAGHAPISHCSAVPRLPSLEPGHQAAGCESGGQPLHRSSGHARLQRLRSSVRSSAAHRSECRLRSAVRTFSGPPPESGGSIRLHHHHNCLFIDRIGGSVYVCCGLRMRVCAAAVSCRDTRQRQPVLLVVSTSHLLRL